MEEISEELNAALDALLREREKNELFVKELSRRDRSVSELRSQVGELRCSLASSEDYAMESRRQCEKEIKALKLSLGSCEKELLEYSTSNPRDLAVLREEARAAIETPLLQRIAEERERADKFMKEASASARECLVLKARAEAASSEATREATAVAEAHLATVAALQDKLREAGLAADETEAANSKRLRAVRDEAAQQAARANEAERETLLLRGELDVLRVAFNREAVARVRELAEAKAAADGIISSRASAERSSEAARAEALALSASVSALSRRLAEAQVRAQSLSEGFGVLGSH